jgi:ATP-dependent Clp protease ATP-binding subunit ClpC
MTSTKKLGFTNTEDTKKTYEDMKKNVMGEVKKIFKPEFLNRIDDIIVFHTLQKEEIRLIAQLMLNEVKNRAKSNMGIKLKISETALDKITDEGYDEVYGARPLRRAIQNKIEDLLAECILNGDFGAGDSVTVDYESDGVGFKAVKM